jgi:spermidine synthase
MARRHYLAIGLLAGVTIFCEIALTRLFSVVQYYHGAFLAISVALFGFAVSGVFVMLRAARMGRERLDATLARYGLLFAAAIPLSFYTYLYMGLAPALSGAGVPGVLAAATEYGLLALPFFASGVCISMLLTHGAADANRLYAADLACSALGAVAVIPALSLLGGPRSMLAASAIAAGASLLFRNETRATRFLAPAAVLAALACLAWIPASAFDAWRIRKETFVVASEQIRWNAFSMVGVGPLTDGGASRSIIIDNSVSTAMTRFDGSIEQLAFLRRDFAAAAHSLKRGGRVLVIGSGGGRDILVALSHGVQHVRAVEVNPLVYQTAAELFGDFTGRVYALPGVQPVIGDARSYVANSSERFDVILASLIDTWAASSAGAFALTENLLYTTDAFRDYYEHLADDGILSISRWHPFETPRLLSTAFTAWEEAGAEDARTHAFLLRAPPPYGGNQIATLLMKKSPFTPSELRELRRFAAEARLSVAMAPDYAEDPVVIEYLAKRRASAQWKDLDLSPATDERPFFFNMVLPSTQALRMLGLRERSPLETVAFQGNLDATRMLIQLLLAVVLLLSALVAAPLLLRGGSVRRPGWPAILGYFACLGLGFILIEVGLLQRLILLLGQPVYALAAILSTMLLASGLGSFASARIAPDRIGPRIGALLAGAFVLLVAYAFLLPDVIDALLGKPFAVRLAAAVALVAVPGLLLGMPFPSGLRALERAGARGLVPWVWGINGAMSVMASVTAIVLAIELGYTAVFLVGAACYGLAAVCVRRWAAAPA